MNRVFISTATVATSLFAMPAFAHTGDTGSASLISGLTHPFTGIDHLFAMFAMGIWLALQGKKEWKSIPVAFTGALLFGFVLGVSGFALPLVETGIATSVLVMGLLIASARHLPTRITLPMVAIFSLFHGFAHGTETGSALITLFAAGFILSSVAIMFSGSQTTRLVLKHTPAVTKVIGLIIAMAGLSFIAA